MLLRDGLWWPSHDVECHRAIFFLDDLKTTLQHVPRERRQLCLQAGGNCGVWANILSHEFAEVWTVEPIAENYACLLRNIEPNVKPIFAALGDKAGTSGFHVNPSNMGASFSEGEGTVPVVTIDDLELPACNLMILDIEGMEPLAIEGAKRTLEKYKPVLLIEDRGHSVRYGFHKNWTAQIKGYRVLKNLKRDTLLVPA